jgi:hypothetical protein
MRRKAKMSRFRVGQEPKMMISLSSERANYIGSTIDPMNSNAPVVLSLIAQKNG